MPFALAMGFLVFLLFAEMGHAAEGSIGRALVIGAFPFLLNGILFGGLCRTREVRGARVASWVVAALLLVLYLNPSTHSALNLLVWPYLRRQPLPTSNELFPVMLVPVIACFGANALGFAFGQALSRRRGANAAD